MNKIKQVPYGIADFETVMKEDLYYVDKTMYIPLLEKQPNYLMFTRPSGFGKSLFLTMLKTYYDKAKKKEFEEIFGSLWIGKHPTPLMGKYLVMHLDFSQIVGTTEQLREQLDKHLCSRLDDFVRKYADDFPDYFTKEFFETTSGDGKLLMISITAKSLRIPIYVFIDGFDEMTRMILDDNITEDDILSAENVFVDFFNKIKGNIERIFITGTEPILFYNQGGGFNFGWNMSFFSSFDELLGFTADDVREMFTYYKNIGVLPVDSNTEGMIETMRAWYGNYCFADRCLSDGNRVFNSGMVWHYLNECIKCGHTPDTMPTLSMEKEVNLVKRLTGLDTIKGNRKKELCEIIEKGEKKSIVETTLFADEILKTRLFTSVLFYHGMLTIKGKYGAQDILGIPNNNVQRVIERAVSK